MTSPADIFNQALEFSGNQAFVTYTGPAGGGGTWAGDGTSALAAPVLYQPTWQMVARQLDPDFARLTVALTPITNGNLPPGWAFEYAYPSDCLRLRCLAPPAGSYDIYDPQLILGNVALDEIASTPTKVIFSNQVNALAVYTSSNLTENDWDPMFTMAVVRQLANPLSMALEGRPDYARELLSQALQYEQMAELSDESATGA
jgi:hypothetical protein